MLLSFLALSLVTGLEIVWMFEGSLIGVRGFATAFCFAGAAGFLLLALWRSERVYIGMVDVMVFVS
jgi:hypothetical protein